MSPRAAFATKTLFFSLCYVVYGEKVARWRNQECIEMGGKQPGRRLVYKLHFFRVGKLVFLVLPLFLFFPSFLPLSILT